MSPSVARCPGCFVPLDVSADVCLECAARPSVYAALSRGTRLGGSRYTLGDPLGEPGGFGITYYAWDGTLERRVAIKEFYPQFLQPMRSEGGTVSITGATGG